MTWIRRGSAPSPASPRAIPAPRFGRRHERTAEASAVLLAAHAHDVDLGGPRRILLEAEKGVLRLDGKGRQLCSRLDVRRRLCLEPEPLGQVAENHFGDARTLRRVADLDDVRHGRPVTRTPAWPL